MSENDKQKVYMNPHDKAMEFAETLSPSEAKKLIRTSGDAGNEHVFALCHGLKGIVGGSAHRAEAYIRRWCEVWGSEIRDADGDVLSFDEVRVMANDIWLRIKHMKGETLTQARELAEQNHHMSIPELADTLDDRLSHLARTCYYLQHLRGNNQFFIGERDAAEVMGLDRVNGRRKARLKLGVLMLKGVIKIVTKGNEFSAARYEYSGQDICKGEF